MADQPHGDRMEMKGMEAEEGSLGGVTRGPVSQTGLSGSGPFLGSVTEGTRDSSSEEAPRGRRRAQGLG